MKTGPRSKRTHWVIPNDLCAEKTMAGEEFKPAMVGAFYGSSLEVSVVATPQYVNAGDCLAPCGSEVKVAFKPKRPYGTFGALVEPDTLKEYQFEGKRALYELTSVDEIEAVADSLEAGQEFLNNTLAINLTYRTTDGKTITYTEAMKWLQEARTFNLSVQAEIEDLITKSGYADQYIGGKRVSKKYPEELLSQIAEIARRKKSVTGMNLKIQYVGKHTIATHRNYVKSSISDDELDALRSKVNYRQKKTFSQGTIRMGSIIVPIQTIDQLKQVKAWLGLEENIYFSRKWPDAVIHSGIELEREYY